MPWLVALAGFALDVAAFWPGQMSFDSAYTWWQARGGTTTDIAPPILIHLWRVCDALVEGPGLVFALHLALFWSGLALIADALVATRSRAAALMLAVALMPVAWLLRAHVWTDVGLFSALVFVVGALAKAHATRRRRWILAALPALFYAGAVRFNALPALLPFALWIGCLVARSRARVMLAAATVFFGSAAFAAIVDAQVDRHVPLWTATAEWDLAAVSVATGEMLLPPFMIGPGLDVDELSRAFRHWSNVPMLQNTTHGMRDPFIEDYTPEQLATLRAAWLDAIRAHPRAWFAQKRRQIVALLGVHEQDWPRELVYVDDEVAYRDNPPVARNRSALHVALMSTAERLRTTRALAGWPYLLIGVVAAGFAWRRRDDLAGVIALTALASAWLYLVPMLPIAPAELRYLGWPCVASVLAAALVGFVPRAFGGGPARLASRQEGTSR
ncbi:MAG: hypothetical protein ABW186_07885 [Rhodanobacteraceae bacterium]